MCSWTSALSRRIRFATRSRARGFLCALALSLGLPQGALAVAVLANPDWDITLTEFGFSDLLIYNAGPFPAGYLHEMLSGE